MRTLQFIVFASVILFACEKNDTNENNNTIKPDKLIIAGAISDFDTLYTLTSEIMIGDSCSDDGSFTGYLDSDSIDLFNNGTYDIKFENTRYEYVVANGSFCPRYFRIHLLTDIEIGYKDNYFDIGLPILLNDTISADLNWTDKETQNLFIAPPGDGREWFDESPCYLAFRLTEDNDTLYGWVKMTDLSHIDEYGVNKK